MLLYTYTTTDMWQYVHHSLRSNTSKMMMTPTTTCAFGRAAVRHNKPAGGSSSLLADGVPRCDVDTQYALASSARVRPSSRRKFRPQKCMIDRGRAGGVNAAGSGCSSACTPCAAAARHRSSRRLVVKIGGARWSPAGQPRAYIGICICIHRQEMAIVLNTSLQIKSVGKHTWTCVSLILNWPSGMGRTGLHWVILCCPISTPSFPK